MPDFGLDILRTGYNNATSLQFVQTDDGTVYLISTQQNGNITVSEVTFTGTGENKTYSETIVFQTGIINTILNHDDDGTLATGVNGRQVTGFHAGLDENGDLELYVTSSDPRIGGGGEANVDEKNLDTNSGVLSKVTIDIPNSGSEAWSATKIDLLRGLPRSEENHSVNGVDFTPDGKLLLMVGGFANAGAPSQNLGYTPEYFLSGTLLEIDVDTLEALPTLTDSEGQEYKYDLPTLGIQRGEAGDGRPNAGFSSRADGLPWGGNDGYNQAYLESGGPVEIFATGFRNGYDVEVVTLEPGDIGYSTEEGADNFRVYVWDNGANNGWGEAPANAQGQVFATHPATGELAIHDGGQWKDIVVQPDGEIFIEENGITGVQVDTGNGPEFLAAERPDNIPLLENNNPIAPGAQDNLHFVERGGYYGSPNLFHANPDAILYLKPELEGGGLDGAAVPAPEFTDENGEIILSLRDFLPPELNGDPLNGFEPSPLSGFYIKPQVGGGPVDDALVLNNGSTNGIVIYEYLEGIHPEDMEIYDGDLFAVGFDEQIIHVDLSEDGRTALNRADIESNNAFQTSPGANPLDITIGPDGTIWVAAHGAGNIFAFVPGGEPVQETENDDADLLFDAFDPFQLDPENGLGENSKVSAGEVFEFTMENEVGSPNGLDGFVLGLTGHMVNYTTEYFTNESGVFSGGVLDGGIAGRLQIEFDAVGDGTAEGASNDVTYALQAGVNFDDSSKRVLLESKITNVWTGLNNEPGQSQGIYFGTGTQFDFASFSFAINDAGEEVVRVYIELNDQQVFLEEYDATGMTDNVDENLVMRVVIDREALTVQAVWEYISNDGPVTGQSAVVDLSSFGDNNLTEAIVGAGQGGFLARGAPENGERANPIFSNLQTDVFVNMGLAVGVTGRVEETNAEGGNLFTPEFDNLLITASDDQGDFAPDARDEIAGSVEFGETLVVDVADLLANDSSFEGGTLSITAVEADGAGTAELINGDTQVSYTPASANDTGFTYTVADSANGATSTAKADVDVTVPSIGGTVVYRVNAGAGTIAAVDGGPDWIGDTTPEGADFLTGDPASTFSSALTNQEAEMDLNNLPDPDAIPWQLFINERSDPPGNPASLEYTFDVDPGATYAVTVYYVENWPGIFTSPDPRVFDIAVNGEVQPEFDDIHPLADAAAALGVSTPGGALTNAEKQPFLGTAFARTVLVTPETGDLVLSFITQTQQPKVNAIEIRELAPPSVDGPLVSISDGVAVEGDGVFFTLDLSDTPDEPVEVTYEIVPGTAIPGVDYDIGSATPDENGVITGTATFAATSTDSSIVVNTIGNETFEGDRTFTVNLLSVSGANALIDTTTATGTILEDDPAPEGTVLFAINAGGTAPVDGALYGLPGVIFDPDNAANLHPTLDLTGATSGNSGNNTNAGGAGETFVNPDGTPFTGDTTLFQTERWSNNFGYNFDVPNGEYTVDLYFAEIFQGVQNASGVGARKFDVSLEGQLVEDDLDLFDEGDGVVGNLAGLPLVPIIKSFTVTVTDGQLNLNLNSLVANGGADNAKISAIVVRSVGEPTPVPAEISIAAPADSVEVGDTGNTTLDFTVSFDKAPSEAVTVDYSVAVNGVTTIAFADIDLGTTGGVISIDVANDDLDNGPESVEVTLVSTTADPAVAVINSAAASATGTVTEDDAPVGPSPEDIDGDGILNTDDPFAFDGTNGDAKVLTAGGEFVQDFNTDATNPFSAEVGFSGIIVNQLVDQVGSSQTDPYGDRTTEAGVTISGGTLQVNSSNTDLFQTGVGTGSGANNQIQNNYQSAADVTGVDSFEIVSRTQNPFAGPEAPALVQFASFGITLGAGGVDDYIKFVLGGSGDGPRIQMAHENSLTGDKEENLVALADAPPANPLIDITQAPEIEFKLVVDKVAGTVQGIATFFAEDGSELGEISTSVRTIDPAGSFAAALNGENPLTGGEGGIAYGISITDWSNATQFTGIWDSLAIRALDPVAGDTLLSLSDAPAAVEAGDAGTTGLVFAITADSVVSGDVEVTYDVTDASGTNSVTETVTLIDGAGTITVPVTNDDIDNGADAVSVTLTAITTPGFGIGAAPTAAGSVTEDEFNTPFDEAISGDLSGENLSPTDIKVALGDNLVTASQQGNPDPTPDDRDFFTITIEEDQVLEAIILESVSLQDTQGFIGLFEGATFNADIEALETDPSIDPAAEGVLGGYLYEATDQGTNILDDMTGIGLGFPLPLPAGTYTFWLNQNGPASDVTLNLQIAEVGSLAIADAPTLVEGGDDAADQLAFAITTTPATEGDVELTFDKTVNGVTTSETAIVTLDAAGQGTLLVDVAQDDADTGDTVVSITLTGTTSTAVTLDAAASNATGTVTEDDGGLAPVGFAPGDDLDQDGTINSEDDDIDGDGALNGLETFRYDATNAGTALAPGESVRLEFDTDGTPFENGLTGALVRPNELPADGGAEEVNLNNANVSGGALNITVTTGDHFGNGNAQQNAFVSAYSAENGLSVETRFAIPDYNPATAGDQDPGNFQSSGVVIGLDQNTLVKAVYGRLGSQFELAQDATNSANGNGSGIKTPGSATTPEGAEEVSIRLEVYTDPDTGEAMATAYYTFFDINGDVIGEPEQAIGTITIVDVPTQGNTLKTLVESGAPLGAGVIQTSTGGGSPSTFDVSYQYLEVTALTPPADEAPTLDQGIAAQATDEDAAFTFAVPSDAFADDGGVENLTLAATQADDTALPAWLAFDPETGTFSGTPENGDVGTVSVKVTATDAAGQSVDALFDLTVNNTNDAPEIAAVGGTDLVAVAGEETVIDLAPLVSVTDVDLGDVTQLVITPSNAEITADGTSITIPASLAAENYTISVTATDLAGAAAPTPVVFNLAVDPAPPVLVSIANAVDATEAGDTGVSFVLFEVTLSEAAEATVNLGFDFTIDGGDAIQAFQQVIFDENGVGVLGVAVPNDDEDNGPELVTLNLTSVNTPGFSLDPGVTTVIGSLLEDDQDVTAPTGVIQPAGDVPSPTDVAVINVVFEDETELDVSSVDGDELSLSDGTNTVVATLLDFDVDSGVAAYLAEAPAGGWAAETLDVTLLAGTVFDVAGNANEQDTSTVTVIPAPITVSLLEAGALTISEADEDAFTLTVHLSDEATQETTVTFAITGDVTADVDYRAIPSTQVVFDVGEDTATILLEIFNDDDFEADEALNLTLLSTTDGEIDPTANTLALTITSEDPDTPVTSDPIVLEAEDFTGLGDSPFFAQGAGDASGNALIRLNERDESTVSTELPDGVTPGVYTIAVTYFDESDGQSTASVAVGGETVGSWIWNNDGPGNAAQGENLRTIEFRNVVIEEGDDFSLTGLRGDGEFVRVDLVTFTRTGDAPTNLPPEGTDIPDLVEVDAGGVFTIPLSYTDPEGGLVTVTATLSDGSPLPDWITLDANGLSGDAPLEETSSSFEITVTATDPEGESLEDTFTLQLNDVTPPEVVLVPTGPADPDSEIRVIVDFQDAGLLDITTAQPEDFSLTGPDGTFAPVELVLNSLTLQIEAIFDAPLDGWTSGEYTAALVDGGLSDLGGNASLPSTPVTFAVTGNETDGPTADISTGGVAGNQEDLLITVTLADETGIDAGTIQPGDLVIEDQNGVVTPATSVVFDDTTNTATFTVSVPSGGFAPGEYGVSLVEGAILDTLGNASAATLPVLLLINDTSAPLGANLDEDLDEDGLINSADADIDEDGTPNELDRFAYDATDGDVALSDLGSINIDLEGLVAGDSPFKAGFTGVMPAFSATTVELDYATNNDAQIVETDNGNRLVVESSPTDTNEGEAAFTFGAKVDDDFTLSGTFDNPYFSGLETPETPANFEQYGLIIGIDGGTFVKFVTGSPGADFELSGKTGNVTDAGPPKTSPLADAVSHAATKLDLSADVTPTAVVFTGTWTTLDVDGNVLQTGSLAPMTLTSGPIFDAIQAGDTALAFGMTHTQFGGPADAFNVSLSELSLTDGVLDITGPEAAITSDGPADADSPIVVSVTYSDETGLDAATINGDELLLTSNGVGDTFGAPVVTPLGDGNYTYTYAAPAGGWSGTVFSASLVAGTIADELGNVNEAGAPVEFTRQDVDPVQEILANLDGVDSDGVYTEGDTGSVILTIMDGVNNVRASNFGANSFELTNTGDKQVAAVFIDVRGALYGDSVFDFDGSGGDTISKAFVVNTETGDGTGAFFEGSASYFLPGEDPGDNTTGFTSPSVGTDASGGFRGLLIKFDGSEGGFSAGELVGFSGDMDPNSLAAITKAAIDAGAIDGWDVGGISGAELIGSSFTVVFDDGTTAEGYLHSDGSLAGSVGEAVQGRVTSEVTVTVNGFASDDTNATYGGTEPVIEVTGTPGETVRVVMSQGFNPVINPNGSPDSVADLVADRLEASQPESFQVNNAFNVQTVDVVIGEDGKAIVPINAFDYNAQPGNVDNPDLGISPIAVTAAVITDSTDTSVTDKVAVGPVAEPVYLTNPTATPVTPAEPPTEPQKVFIAENGTVVFEAENADRTGTSGWVFETTEEASNESPAPSGDGYIIWEGGNSFGDPAANSTLSYTFVTDEGGNWVVKGKFGRRNEPDTTEANDIFLRLVDSEGNPVDPVPQTQGGETVYHVKTGEVVTEDELASAGSRAVVNNPEKWMKFYIGGVGLDELNGGGQNGDNGGINVVYDLDPNETYTLQIAGRSNDFEVDKLAISNNGAGAATSAANNAPESAFFITGPTEPEVDVPIDDLNVVQGEVLAFTIPDNAFDDADGDALTLTAPGLPAGFTFENGVLSASDDLPIGSYPITIVATDNDNNSVSQTFNVVIAEQGVQQDFQAVTLVSTDDIELGSALNSNDLETNLNVQVRLTIEDGVSNVTSVDSALISWVSDRTHSGDATLTFQVEDTLEPGDFQPNKDYLPVTVDAEVSGTWQDEATIENVADIADLINALIASQGPLNGGDVINLQFTGEGATRFIVQQSVVLDISTSGGSGSGGNTPPVVDNALPDLDVQDGDGVSIDLSNVFSDADNDALSFSVSGLPNGVSLDNGVISGTPTQTGTFTVSVTANDGQATATDVFELTVLPEGTDTVPTVANPIADQSIETGEAFSFTVPGNVFDDADGDTLSVSISAPAGFTVSGTTVSAPASLAAGVYPISVSALDEDGNTVSDTFNLTVSEVQDTVPTVANPIADQEIETGQGFSFTVPGDVFEDADGDTLNVSIAAPAGFAVNGTTVSAPSGLSAGVYPITVFALDEDENTVSDTFNLTVTEPVETGDITLWLVDAETDQRIRPLEGSDFVLSSEFEAGVYNLEAVYNPGGQGSVVFKLNGSTIRTENGAPYVMYSHRGADYNEVPLPADGTQQVVTVEVYSSGGGGGILLGSSSFALTFSEGEVPNRAPVVNNLVADDEVALGAQVAIDVSNVFSDPDNDSLTLEASGLPAGLSFDGTSITGTPTTPGTSDITVTASDGELTASDTFTLTVLPDSSTVPVVNAVIEDQVITDAEAFSLTVPGNAFDDADGDALTVSIAAPAGFSVNGSTVSAPAGLAPGTYDITVTASDDDLNSVSQTFTLTVEEQPPQTVFSAVTLVKSDDKELSQGLNSGDLETNYNVQVRLTIEDGVSNVTSVESALISWVTERTHSGTGTLVFQVEDNKDPGDFVANKSYVPGSVEVPVSGTWQEGQLIENVVDIADLVNALIASQGPLNSGDVINLQFTTGQGATRFIEQLSVKLDLTTSSEADPVGATAKMAALAPTITETMLAMSPDDFESGSEASQAVFDVPVFEIPVQLTNGLEMQPVGALSAAMLTAAPGSPGMLVDLGGGMVQAVAPTPTLLESFDFAALDAVTADASVNGLSGRADVGSIIETQPFDFGALPQQPVDSVLDAFMEQPKAGPFKIGFDDGTFTSVDSGPAIPAFEDFALINMNEEAWSTVG